MKHIILGLMVVFLLSGCSTMGENKFSSAYVKAHIIENKTTLSEVQAIYGTPDDQDVYSDGSGTWIYRKKGNLDTVSSLVKYIPGTQTVSSALGVADTASDASDAAQKASGKMSGNTDHTGTLFIRYNSNKIVSSWMM